MWRLMGVLAAVLALAGITMLHGAVSAQAAAEKQILCHVSPDEGDHFIEVSVNAVPAHLRNHGDCLISSTDRTLIDQPCDATDADGDDICDVQP
jgi:ABC-type sugar transport system substrate-binding protein